LSISGADGFLNITESVTASVPMADIGVLDG
jgi:hypothetical protein